MSINSDNYASLKLELETEPAIYSADYWRIELSKLVLQLVQEVATLKPGIRFDADLRPIIQTASATPNRPGGRL